MADSYSKKMGDYYTPADIEIPHKISKPLPYIGTHDGTFHCDDVTACYMLKTLDRFKDHDIVRTREQEKLDGADIVVDVGGVLDVEKLRLDHHQRSFNQTIKDYHPNLKVTNPAKPIRLSSAGLVYSIFGKDYIVKQMRSFKTYAELDSERKKIIDIIFQRAYLSFFEEIDAIDNGVDIATGDNIIYNYHINSGISSRVARLNPEEKDATPERRLHQFKLAMQMVGAEIEDGIRYLSQIWYPRYKQFREFVLKRKEFDPSGQLVFIDSDDRVSWNSSIFDIEEELGIVGEIKFVIYTDVSSSPAWRATAVPVAPRSFSCRTPYKEEWRGKRDEDLQQVSGVPDATFVHMSGFTGGAKSKEGIMALVLGTLNLQKSA